MTNRQKILQLNIECVNSNKNKFERSGYNWVWKCACKSKTIKCNRKAFSVFSVFCRWKFIYNTYVNKNPTVTGGVI